MSDDKKQFPYPGIPTTSDGAGCVVWVETNVTNGACAYPITSSTTMGTGFQTEVSNGKKNLWGDLLTFVQPESEHSAASTCEGYALAGGRVTNFTSGQGLVLMKEVLYTISGKRLPVALGDKVLAGDTLVTGKTGAIHVRMNDTAFISVRPDTRLVVQSFVWNGKEDGLERAVFSLLRGGFRTITGVIGRRTKENYLVNTPTATIGIRGTDHEPHYIDVGDTTQGEPGTYNKVNVGATFIRNAAGTVELGPNEAGFAPAAPGNPSSTPARPWRCGRSAGSGGIHRSRRRARRSGQRWSRRRPADGNRRSSSASSPSTNRGGSNTAS